MRVKPSRVSVAVAVIGLAGWTTACAGDTATTTSTNPAPTTALTTSSTTTTTVARIEVPSWVNGLLTPDEYADFVSFVTAYWEGSTAALDFANGTIEHPDYGSLGLLNLTQSIAALPHDEWGGAVANHFDVIVALTEEAAAREDILSDWDQVSPRLRIRIAGLEILEDESWSDLIVKRELAPDLFEILVVDFPDAALTLLASTLDKLGVSPEQAFDVARDNTLTIETVTSQEFDAGGCRFLLYGGSFYTASHIVGIDELLSDDNEFGALVAVAVREDLLIHEVRDQSFHCAAMFMGTVIPSLFEQGPGAVSPDFYWYIDGEFHLVRVTEEDSGTLRLEFPPELQPIVDNLPPVE